MTPTVPVLHGEVQPSNGEFVRNAGCDQGLVRPISHGIEMSRCVRLETYDLQSEVA